MGTRKERTSKTDSFRLEIQGFPMRKQERKHERGRPSGIEGVRRLRVRKTIFAWRLRQRRLHLAIGLSRIRSSKSLICSPSELSFRANP
jgi:hypothetical protein